MKTISNLLIFQLIWFLSISGENQFIHVSIFLISIHFFLSENREADIKMIIFLVPIGIFLDAALTYLEVLRFTSQSYFIPSWLIVIWMAIATLPHNGLAWLKGKYVLATLLGCIGGPLAYSAGVIFGVASFPLGTLPTICILALLWGFIWPIVMYFAKLQKAEISLPILRAEGKN